MNGLKRPFCALATVIAVLALGNSAALADTPPEVPVTFSGTLAAGETQTVHFTVPDMDFYRATVSPADAPITLTLTGQYPSPPIPNWQSGGLIPLITYSLDIHSPVATTYDVDVEEIPPKLTNVSGGTQYLGPNGSYTAGYTLDVPAYVEPVLTDASNNSIVVPVSYMKSPGAETSTWSLRDADGNRLPDGFYNVALTARNSTAVSLSVPVGEAIIDSTPPKISLKVDPSPSNHERVWVDVLDPGAHPAGMSNPFGVAHVTASADGRAPQAMGMTGRYPTEWDWYTIPGGVWAPGTHTVTVQATDLLGNMGSSSISFTVPAPRPRPDCSTLAIKNAVRTAQPVNAALRRVGHVRRGDVFRHFLIAKRSCPTELTHDAKAEMVVLLREQHGQKTVVAIFSQNGPGWSFDYVDAGHRVDTIDQIFWDPVENLHPKPHHKPRRIRLHWDGSKFQQIPL